MVNPFALKGYTSASFFCDRERETGLLIDNALNGINTTLLSIRRMGKTGLLHHVLSKIKRKKGWKGIYVDIYATQNVGMFAEKLAESILMAFPKNKSVTERFMDVLRKFNPVITYDPYTGSPEVSFQSARREQIKHTLEGLFSFLDNQGVNVLVAIDEFQQIRSYKQTNTEAVLRTIIQGLQNVQFIFSGSHRNMLADMFNNPGQPFFSSTQSVFLNPIDKTKYSRFIRKHLESGGIQIEDEALEFLLNWTKSHTYYTQFVANKVFQSKLKTVDKADLLSILNSILKEQEIVFYQYRNLLTEAQWNLVRAVAKEDGASRVYSSGFIHTHGLGNGSSVKRSLEALLDKEMLYEKFESDSKEYHVYDCFLSRWLERY